MARRFSRVIIAALLIAAGARAWTVEPPLEDAATPDTRPGLTLSFVGDIMHHARNAEMPDYDRLYDSVRGVLSVDDLSFANIEFPVDPAQKPAGYPVFNGSVAYLEAVTRAGFDVLALANNHSFDLEEEGIDASRAVYADLQNRVRLHVNGFRDAPGAPISVTEIYVRGWHIGFVSITSFSNAPGAAPHVHLVDYFEPEPRAAFLQQVGSWSEKYDVLVVGVHAGVEYTRIPAAHKAEFLREIADAGAHIVWGHHPHVLQPWERRGDRLVIHSAGNFISGQRRHQSPYVPLGRWAPTGDTAIYQVRVELERGETTIGAVRTPLFTMYEDPTHGLVLRSFHELLAREHSLHWRAFYLARYSAMQSLVSGTQ